MRSLIVRGALLILLAGMTFGPVCYLLHTYYQDMMVSDVLRFKREIKVLIAGDSHAETSVDPNILPNSINIGQSTENYFFSYYKLRHLLDLNPQISVIILSFSWHNLSAFYEDSKLLGSSGPWLDTYFPLLDESGKEKVASLDNAYLAVWARYTFGFVTQLYRERAFLQHVLGEPMRREDTRFIGGFHPLEAREISARTVKDKLDTYFGSGDTVISPCMIEYLRKILDLSAARNIRMILLNSPVHGLYSTAVPKEMKRNLDALAIQLTNEFRNVSYLDYTEFPLPPNGYADSDHPSRAGAVALTRELAKQIGQGCE